METHPFVVYLISLLCSLYMVKFMLVIQSNASNAVHFDKIMH